MAIRTLCTLLFLVAVAGLAIQQTGCRPTPVSQADSSTRLPRTEKEFRDKLAGLRMQKEKLDRGIQRLEDKKQETVDYLKSKGVTAETEISGKPDLEYAVRNLKGWVDEIKTLKLDLGKYDQAIAAIETMLDEIERKRVTSSVAISEEDWIKMESIVIDLNEKLDMGGSEFLRAGETKELLESELGNSEPADSGN